MRQVVSCRSSWTGWRHGHTLFSWYIFLAFNNISELQMVSQDLAMNCAIGVYWGNVWNIRWKCKTPLCHYLQTKSGSNEATRIPTNTRKFREGQISTDPPHRCQTHLATQMVTSLDWSLCEGMIMNLNHPSFLFQGFLIECTLKSLFTYFKHEPLGTTRVSLNDLGN